MDDKTAKKILRKLPLLTILEEMDRLLEEPEYNSRVYLCNVFRRAIFSLVSETERTFIEDYYERLFSEDIIESKRLFYRFITVGGNYYLRLYNSSLYPHRKERYCTAFSWNLSFDKKKIVLRRFLRYVKNNETYPLKNIFKEGLE